MYLNVNINGASNLKIAVVSIAEMRAIQKNVQDTAKSIPAAGDEQVARIIAEGDEGVVVSGLKDGAEVVIAKPDILLKILAGVSIVVEK